MSSAISLPTALLEGRHEPMGSHVRDGGVNFAVFSQNAQRIELCVFDITGEEELQRYDLFGPDDCVFHGFLPGAGAGLVYGLRAHGSYEPNAGHRFNPYNLLLDPNAREIVALKARVAAPSGPAPGRSNAPRHRSADLVIYELHVKGFSKLHPTVTCLRRNFKATRRPSPLSTAARG